MATGSNFSGNEDSAGKSKAHQILERLKVPESVAYSMQFNPQEILTPNPIMKLEYVLGFTGRQCPDIRWNPHHSHSNDLIYATGNLLVSMNVKT